MGQDHLDQLMDIHQARNPFEQVNVLGVQRDPQRRFQVSLRNTVIDGNIDYFTVLLVFGVCRFLLAPSDVLFYGFVDQDLGEIAVVSAADFEIVPSSKSVAQGLIVFVQEVVDLGQ